MKKLLMIAVLVLLAFPVWAENSMPDVASIENYLNGITTLSARFTQTSSDGSSLPGNFLLKRPGRMRFQYDAPIEDFIVADGLLVYRYDAEMKQQSSVPISKSLADFFLRPNLRLSGDINVTGMFRKDGMLQLTLVQAKEPEAGKLTLLFFENPLQIAGWRVDDAQGITTMIQLTEVKTDLNLKNDLFRYYDPKKSSLNK